jgi:hypothetical protein
VHTVVVSSHACAQIVRPTSLSRNTLRKWSKAPVLEVPKYRLDGLAAFEPLALLLGPRFVLATVNDLHAKLVRPACLAIAGAFDLGRLQCDIDSASRLAPID